MTNSRQKSGHENGNAVVIALVVLVVAAVGVLAFMSGKINIAQNQGDSSIEVAANEEGAQDGQSNPVVAILNGEEIKRQDVLVAINSMPPQMRAALPAEQLYPMALEQLISNKIIEEKAMKAGLENDETVLEQLEVAKTQIIRTQFLENEIKAGITDELVNAEYEQYVKDFPEVDEVKAAHILVDDEKLAKDLIKKLDKGAAFDVLAAENSKDGSAAQGGDIGYFAKEEVVPEFADAAFAMKVGEYSKKPVKSDFGYHIIRVDDARKRPPADLEQVKPMIEQKIGRQVFEEKVAQWKDAVEIERFDFNGQPLNTAEPAAGQEAAAEAETAADAQAQPDEAAAEEVQDEAAAE